MAALRRRGENPLQLVEIHQTFFLQILFRLVPNTWIDFELFHLAGVEPRSQPLVGNHGQCLVNLPEGCQVPPPIHLGHDFRPPELDLVLRFHDAWPKIDQENLAQFRRPTREKRVLAPAASGCDTLLAREMLPYRSGRVLM